MVEAMIVQESNRYKCKKKKKHSFNLEVTSYLKTVYFYRRYIHLNNSWGCPRDVMVKAIDSAIVVSEFELQSRYYVHFRTNTLGKGMNPVILPAMG